MTTAIPTEPAKSTALEIRPIRRELIEALRTFKSENGITDKRLASLIGSNPSAVNRAFNEKFIGDPLVFERKAEDFLRNEPLRRKARETLFENDFSLCVTSFLEAVRRTNDIGLGYSAAGKGKTCGIHLYLAANATAIGVELAKWSCGSRGLARSIYKAIDNRAISHKTNIAEVLIDRLKDSNRLVVIDNAHRLSASGRQWLFDFHDATNLPIALVGNPEVLDAIRRNDQQFSRIGLRTELIGKDAKLVAETMVERHWPEGVGHLGKMPLQVLKGRGHVRALKKQLLLAKDLLTSGDESLSTPAAAFRAAHSLLIRDYSLEAGS